ncbi:unnamed protein product, partial [marine sediment metagenome]
EREIVAKNLRQYRQVKGMLQKDLAAKVGLSKDTISKIETGKQHNIGMKFLVSICRELNISIEELFLENPGKLRIEIVASEKGIKALKEIAKQFKIVS